MACTGPSLLDLSIITNSTTDSIAYVFTARSAGGLLGVIISSMLINFFNNWVSVCFLHFVKNTFLNIRCCLANFKEADLININIFNIRIQIYCRGPPSELISS